MKNHQCALWSVISLIDGKLITYKCLRKLWKGVFIVETFFLVTHFVAFSSYAQNLFSRSRKLSNQTCETILGKIYFWVKYRILKNFQCKNNILKNIQIAWVSNVKNALMAIWIRRHTFLQFIIERKFHVVTMIVKFIMFNITTKFLVTRNFHCSFISSWKNKNSMWR